MLQEGIQAPDFTLLSGEGHSVSLSDFIGKKVILYFYPRDNTPGCTTEACQFRDSHDDYRESGAVVIGVSPDTAASHKKFSSAHDLPFLLLADPDKAVIRLYEAEKEKNMYGRKVLGVQRCTYVIDEEGTIVKAFASVKADGHAGEVLSFLDSLG